MSHGKSWSLLVADGGALRRPWRTARFADTADRRTVERSAADDVCPDAMGVDDAAAEPIRAVAYVSALAAAQQLGVEQPAFLWHTPFGANAGFPAPSAQPALEPWNDPRSSIFAQTPWGSMTPPPSLFGLSPTFPSAPPAPSSATSIGSGDRSNSYWWQSVANVPPGGYAGMAAPTPQPNYPWDKSVPSWWGYSADALRRKCRISRAADR